MQMDDRLDALKRALGVVGNREALCKALWISQEELDDYLEAEKAIPESLYLATLNIADNGNGSGRT